MLPKSNPFTVRISFQPAGPDAIKNIGRKNEGTGEEAREHEYLTEVSHS